MTKAIYKIGLLTCCLFLSVAMAGAQAVKTTISANRILIGEQIMLEIKISSASAAYQIGIKVPDSIPHFDIMDRHQSDTVDEKGVYTLRQEVLLTSFDSGVFVIPSFPITVSEPNQPVKILASDSEQVSVSYNPMLIGPPKDIKPIIDFGEKQGKLGYIIAGAITILLLWLLVYWYLKSRPKKPLLLSSAALSPYEEAMSSLQQLSPPLHQELEPLKIWYMALTDVLKKYYSRKTNRNMMGHTTSQFLGRMKAENKSNPQLVSAAAKALDCADAVKFAKYIPTPEELAESVLLIKHTINSLEKKPLKQPSPLIFQYLKHIEFSQPAFFGLFLLLPVLLYWYVKQINGRTASMMVSSTAAHGLHSWRSAMRHVPFVFRLLCLSCIITALAKPQMRFEKLRAEGRGIDIILCIDVSGSMTAQDFSPNRLEAAKEVAIHFVQNRISDQIGVVVFSGESFTQCPPTTDYGMLISSISSIRNSVLQEGTAIGSGLATSIDRLRSSSSKSKIVVLLTDGENNGGFIDPKAAKEIAKAFGVKVYTIGVGTDGFARQPVKTDHGIEIKIEKVTIDEKLLTEIATETGGQYFRARDNAQLSGIYAQIDAMEKSEVQVIRSTRYAGKQIPFIAAAIFLLLAEIILRYILLRKFP